MKYLYFLCIVAILVIIGCFVSNRNSISEGFISGVQVQLLTSKPYYTQYDYLSSYRRNPYYYGSTYYRNSYEYPYYNYGDYPYYSPRFY